MIMNLLHLRSRWSTRPGRTRSERGATVVEAAIVTPLFIGILFMILELGPFFFEWSSGKNGATEGVRLIAAAGRSRTADYDTVQSMRNSLKNLDKKLDYVIVFKARNLHSKVPAACITAAEAGKNLPSTNLDPVGVFAAPVSTDTSAEPTVVDTTVTVESGYDWNKTVAQPWITMCNVYYARMFDEPVGAWTYQSDWKVSNPTHPSFDHNWPGDYRRDFQSGPQDIVGVYVQSHHDSITGFFPQLNNRTIRNQAVVRIEPLRPNP